MPRKAKNYDELELKDDFMFGMVMRNPKYVKPFLEAILKIKIRKVVYPESQKAIDLSANAKGVRLDVYVEDDQNTVFNLEMQTTHKKDLPKRMRYYQGMIDLNILNKGESYCNLKKSYVIFICTFDPFGEGRHIYTFCNTCQENTSLTLNDDAVKIVLNTKGTIDDVSPEMKRILDYIEGKGASDTFTRELENAVQSVRQNEDWRRDYMYMTLQQEYQERFQEGKIEGKIELLAHDFHLTVPEIAEKLLLSEDEVQRILDHLQ